MKRVSKKKSESTESQQLQFQMQWSAPADVPTLYANQLLVSRTGLNEVYLVFGEVQLPMIVNPQNPPPSLEVRPLVKIVVVPEVMRNMLEALNANMNLILGQDVSGESAE